MSFLVLGYAFSNSCLARAPGAEGRIHQYDVECLFGDFEQAHALCGIVHKKPPPRVGLRALVVDECSESGANARLRRSEQVARLSPLGTAVKKLLHAKQ